MKVVSVVATVCSKMLACTRGSWASGEWIMNQSTDRWWLCSFSSRAARMPWLR